jgi:hypothetical protein
VLNTKIARVYQGCLSEGPGTSLQLTQDTCCCWGSDMQEVASGWASASRTQKESL